ncbi:amino acid permease-domain-containing protein [Mycena polygramma]|nr:amino acid permease-domain-containing protein [Mycena polygramma]
MDDHPKSENLTGDSKSISEKADVSVWAIDNAKLAELGYKSEFKREFSLLETCAFSFSIMAARPFPCTVYLEIPLGGHVGLLASSMPTSAGLYYFSAKMAPEKHAPLASWITGSMYPGWANITGQVALVCSIDFTCAQMITTAIAVGSDGETILSAGATYGILLAILFAHGIVCSAATKILARLNLFYVVVNVGTTLVAIISLLVVSGENKVSTKDAFTLFENNSGWTNTSNPRWTLTGYDSAAHISEETAGAGRAAPIAILVGTCATACFGWLLMISISFVIPSIDNLLGTSLPLPMGQVFLEVLGKRGMLTIFSFIIIVQFVTGAAQGVDASRVVFAFARDDALPGSRWWKRMSSNAVPVNAVWFVMFWSAILGLLGFSVAALSSLAGLPGPFSLGRWSTPIGAIAIAWVGFIVIVLLFPPGQETNSGSMNYAVLIVMAVFMFAAISWVTSAHKWFHGPIRNVDDTAEKCST